MSEAIIQPGLHAIEDEAYHALDFCSKHALDVIADRSPMHLWYRRQHPEPATEAMLIGRAFHTSVLEPDKFAARHPIRSQCVAIKKGGARCEYPGKFLDADGWRCGTHAEQPNEVPGSINEATAASLLAMADAISRHPAANDILKSAGPNEQAAIWDRYVDGDGWRQLIRCKLKADAIRPTWDAVVDVKTAESAAPDDVAYAIKEYGYHRQAAFYLDGLAAVGQPLTNFVLIVVEKGPPHGVAAYSVSRDAIDLGREQNEKLVRTYATCERTGYWPGYETEFRDISLTPAAFRAAMAEV